MNISLSKREKTLIFILGVLIVFSVAYKFFFNPQLEKWLTQKSIYDDVQIMVNEMNQSDEELGERKKQVEALKIEAEKLAVGYYLDYTNHMAEQRITSILVQAGLNPSYVDVQSVVNEPFIPYGAAEENASSVNAATISLSFDTSGSLENLTSLLTTIDRDTGLHLNSFSLSGNQEGIYYMSLSLKMLLGSTQGVLDEQ